MSSEWAFTLGSYKELLSEFNIINVPLTDNKRQAQIDEENWVKVTTYEEAFMRIKDATGVSDIDVSKNLHALHGQRKSPNHNSKLNT